MYMCCFTASCVARRRPGSLWSNIICALTRKTLTLLLANNKGADQPAHPCSLFSAFVICNLKSKVKILQMFFVGFNMMKPDSHVLSGSTSHEICSSMLASLNSLPASAVCWYPLQTVWTHIRPWSRSKMLHSDSIPERFFKKSCRKCF